MWIFYSTRWWYKSLVFSAVKKCDIDSSVVVPNSRNMIQGDNCPLWCLWHHKEPERWNGNCHMPHCLQAWKKGREMGRREKQNEEEKKNTAKPKKKKNAMWKLSNMATYEKKFHYLLKNFSSNFLLPILHDFAVKEFWG